MCSRLRDMDFHDLLIEAVAGPSGVTAAFLKGVPGRDGALLPVFPGDTACAEEVLTIYEGLRTLGAQEASYLHDGVSYRATGSSTVKGQLWVLRKPRGRIPALGELGFPAALVRRLVAVRGGLVVFSGAMGQGKTTSASAFVHERLVELGGHAVTLESPPELPLHGPHGGGYCFQREIPESSYEEGLIRSLRLGNPSLIFLGELRAGGGTVQALQAAINGHLIVATAHASGVEETLMRLVSLAAMNGVAPHALLADGLSAVVHQQLQPHGNKHILHLGFLFADDESSASVRGMIREQRLHQLGTEITAQRNRLLARPSGFGK